MTHQVWKAIAITLLLLLAWIGLVSGAQPDHSENTICAHDCHARVSAG